MQLLRRRVAAIDVAAGQCSLEQTPATSIVPTLTPEQDGAWISGLDLAKTTGRPLWCDDRVLRAIARQVGVSTFGTLALLEALGPTVMDEEAVLARLLAFHVGVTCSGRWRGSRSAMWPCSARAILSGS